jgi:hypothetical protein
MTPARWNPGLCADCRHAQSLASKRSHYLRCRLSEVDPRFPRYPALPVLACDGYAPGAERGASPARGEPTP